MRRSVVLFLLLLPLLAFVSCRRGEPAAETSTPVSAATAATAILPSPTNTHAETTPTPNEPASVQPEAGDAAREVATALQRQIPPLPAKEESPAEPLPDVEGSATPLSTSAETLPLPTSTFTPTSVVSDIVPPEAGAPIGVVNVSVLNVRTGPGTVYPVVAQVKQSSDFPITGRNEDGSWLKICCPTGEESQNWIAAEFVDMKLSPDETLLDLPLAEIPPTPEPSGNTASIASAAPAPAPASAAGLPGPGPFSAPGSINPLTGQPLPAGRNGQRPVIVCINNDYAARPQFGTSQADVVYEYLMEGYSITRFSAIYYGGSSGQIGPVRSARLINYYMGALYDAGLACSGASDQVRYALKHQAPFPYLDIDLDDPSNTRYSVSIGSDYRTRLRTSTDQLRRWLADWGVEKPAAIRGFTFGSAPAGGSSASTINIPYPNGQVNYRYDAGRGQYLRFLSGSPHVDGNTGEQLALDNVIVQVVPHQATDIVEDSLGSTSIRLNLFGSGQAIVFRNGRAFEGTWRSESRGDTPRFYNTGGAEIPLKPGHTWISVVPPTYTIDYQ